MDIINNPQRDTQLFWGEIAPGEHLIKIYEDDQGFFDTLIGYVAEGLKAYEGVIVIARKGHLAILEEQLAAQNIDLAAATAENRYITRDAEQLLSTFLVNDWPDRDLFCKAIVELLALAKGPGRKVRAFGELVSILWERGHTAATVNLEHLWHELIQQEGFPLFCAYPKSGFTRKNAESINEIYKVHTSIIDTTPEKPGVATFTPCT